MKSLDGKYEVTYADGSPMEENADALVLRLDQENEAGKAAMAYAFYMMNVDPKLAGLIESIVIVNNLVKVTGQGLQDDSELAGLQRMVVKTISYPKVGNNIGYPAAALEFEAKSMVDACMAKAKASGFASDKEKENFMTRLGDILWTLGALCNELGVELYDVDAHLSGRLANGRGLNQLQKKLE